MELVSALDLEEALEREEGVAAKPGEEPPGVASQTNERDVVEMGVACGRASLGEPAARVVHEVGIVRILHEHAQHALEHDGVDVAGAVAKVGRHLALYLRGVDEVAFVVDLLDEPGGAGDGELLAHGRRQHDGAELLGLVADGVLFVFLEDAVEAVAVDDALARDADDETTLLGKLDVVDVDEVM